MRSPLLLLPLVAPAILTAQTPAGRFTARVQEWPVPFAASLPVDPYADSQGRVWFTGEAEAFVAYLDPATGRFRRYDVDPGTRPRSVIVDAAGRAWYAGGGKAMIGRIDPASGLITRFRLDDPALADPRAIAFDRRGNLWITAGRGDAVARMEMANGRLRTVRLQPGSVPDGLVVDSTTDRPWFAESGAARIGTVDPNTFELREYALPDTASRVRRIALVDGRLVAGDAARGAVVRLDPANGNVATWPLPDGATSQPWGMSQDDRGRTWVAVTGTDPARFLALDPGTGAIVGEAAPRSGGIVRSMRFDRRTRFIWFGSDSNVIGRIEVP